MIGIGAGGHPDNGRDNRRAERKRARPRAQRGNWSEGVVDLATIGWAFFETSPPAKMSRDTDLTT